MDAKRVQSILQDPEFKTLARHKALVSWTLSLLMLAVYYGFILVLAFEPKLLATPFFDGEKMTWGIPVGMGIIVFAIVITGLYTWYSNKDLDAHNERVLKHFNKGDRV